MNKIPDVVNGYCDSLGCAANVCWCEEYTKMQNEFQRVHNVAWGSGSDIERAWEQAWRFGTKPLLDIINGNPHDRR